jgi:hypothetical protein
VLKSFNYFSIDHIQTEIDFGIKSSDLNDQKDLGHPLHSLSDRLEVHAFVSEQDFL